MNKLLRVALFVLLGALNAVAGTVPTADKFAAI